MFDVSIPPGSCSVSVRLSSCRVCSHCAVGAPVGTDECPSANMNLFLLSRRSCLMHLTADLEYPEAFREAQLGLRTRPAPPVCSMPLYFLLYLCAVSSSAVFTTYVERDLHRQIGFVPNLAGGVDRLYSPKLNPAAFGRL